MGDDTVISDQDKSALSTEEALLNTPEAALAEWERASLALNSSSNHFEIIYIYDNFT